MVDLKVIECAETRIVIHICTFVLAISKMHERWHWYHCYLGMSSMSSSELELLTLLCGKNCRKIGTVLSLYCLVVTHYYCQTVVGNLAVLILESLTASVAKVHTASVANPEIRTSDHQGDYYAE